MTIIVRQYWPFNVKNTAPQRFDYVDPTNSMPPITSVFSWDKGSDSLLLTDFDAHLNFKDQWFMRVDSTGQVIEWLDKYPNNKVINLEKPFGAPIEWGSVQNIGDTLVTYPKMNPLKSWPPAFSSGVQIVVFEDVLDTLTMPSGTVYTDVLQFTYLQSWGSGYGTGARYWMPKNVGPVQLQWLAQDPSDPTRRKMIETNKMYATVTSM